MNKIMLALAVTLALTAAPAARPAASYIAPATAWEEVPEFPFGGDPDFEEIDDDSDIGDDIDEETGVTTTTITLPSGEIIVIRHGIYQGSRASDFAEPPAEYDSVTGEQTWDDTTAICQDYGGCE